MKKSITFNTENLKKETILRYYKAGFGYGIFILTENLSNFLIVRSDIEEAPFLTHGDIIELYLWSENSGSWEWESRVLGKISSEEQYIVLSHSDSATWNEERKCIRAKVDIPFHYFSIQQNNDHKIFESEKPDILYGRIKELTDRIAVVESASPIQSSIIRGHVSLNKNDIDFTGVISATKDNITTIEFTGMSDKTRIEILDYIYKSYRE